ncbi:DNA transposition protein [Elysia marginata]|uniref:DNA transposition protein n=1 Tax=Elysia marginata TaxID=1093978 RepID=A0AAV4GUE6_9GAST|nr:DNA transposition protein [Elysia marginata]
MNINERIQEEVKRLGSQSAVANKCRISNAALSQYISGKYGADVQELENKIVIGLNVRYDGWQVAETRDLKKFHMVYKTAKLNSVFVGVSEKAGSGKSASINTYEQHHDSVFVVRCREWTGRMFLDEVVRMLGLELPKGYVTMDTKLTRICNFFKERRQSKPQLIIDEADKLRPSALRTLIPLYNECEGLLSVVITGTDNLQKEIKNGVKYARKGYDEIDSRFGRRYIKATGAVRSDVTAICQANGLTDLDKIGKIWEACPKVRKEIEGRDVQVVEDIRLLKNLILFG